MTPLTQLERRLELLKTEVGMDFPGLVQELEAGIQIVLVTDRQLGKSLDPDILRRIGGMTMLCDHYDAAVIFIAENKVSWRTRQAS